MYAENINIIKSEFEMYIIVHIWLQWQQVD